ncbi:MAG: rod shape-determining protein MreC [Bacteroidales bacterium]|nr:rod shape-determining protein MreC [Bacteroidales bacterium]
MLSFFRFLLKHNFIIIFLLLEAISIWLVLSSNDYQRFVSGKTVSSIEGGLYKFTSNITGFFKLRSANDMLMEENAMLRDELNASLRDDCDSIPVHVYRHIPANIIYNTVNKRNNYMIIDKGTDDGILEEMGVISSTSIVGVVVNAGEKYSSVLPVLHQRTKISVKLKNENEYGVVKWEGYDYRKGVIEEIPVHSKIKLNDTIVTSGRSQRYPEGIPVGVISDFSVKEGTGFYSIEITFIEDYRKVNKVYAVENMYKTELDSLKMQFHE